MYFVLEGHSPETAVRGLVDGELYSIHTTARGTVVDRIDPPEVGSILVDDRAREITVESTSADW